MRPLLAALLAIGLAGCAGRAEAVDAAKARGYINPRVVKTYFMGELHCWSEDDTAYELAAFDRNERPVKLIACCHFTCSIRKALF
jgi:hypothetical protein